MPKKSAWGENTKATEARERRANAKASAAQAAARVSEDHYWEEAGEGAQTKAQRRRGEAEASRAEAAAKKAEARRLAKEEEEALPTTSSAAKANRSSAKKVTHAQLAEAREAEAKARSAELKERQMAARREATEDSYSELVGVANVNRLDTALEARNLDQALAAMAVVDEDARALDKHPEKRVRAAFAQYEARELPLLKQEKPNLKQAQYRDMLWKNWQKSPENPVYQASLAAAHR